MANSPIRVSDDLIEQAEKQTKLSYRSLQKQIEFWAQIGKEVELNMTAADVAALVNGEAQIKILRKISEPVEFDGVFEELETNRKKGNLQSKIVKDKVWFEESIDYPGMLIRFNKGKKEIGTFKDGRFKVTNTKIISSAKNRLRKK